MHHYISVALRAHPDGADRLEVSLTGDLELFGVNVTASVGLTAGGPGGFQVTLAVFVKKLRVKPFGEDKETLVLEGEARAALPCGGGAGDWCLTGRVSAAVENMGWPLEGRAFKVRRCRLTHPSD